MNNNLFIADAHCDTIGYIEEKKSDGLINEYNTSSKYPHLQVYAMYCAVECEDEQASSERALRYEKIYREYTERENIYKCFNANDINTALQNGATKLSMLSIEGCECLNGSLENLHRFYENGVRILGLVWNQNNRYACGSLATGTEDDRGLTPEGVRLIEECDKLGIIVDLSHSSDNTIKDVLQLAKRPVAATHSNFRTVCSHSRNLTDEHALALARSGGFIGLNLYYKFASQKYATEANSIQNPDYSLSALCAHIEHAKKLRILNHIGFGLDIDGVSGIYPSDCDLEESIHDKLIDVMSEYQIAYEETEQISGRNFLDFIQKYYNM